MKSDISHLLPNWALWIFSISGVLFLKNDRCRNTKIVLTALVHGILLWAFIKGFNSVNQFWRNTFGETVVRSIRAIELLSILIRLIWNIWHRSQYDLFMNHLSHHHIMMKNRCNDLGRKKIGFFILVLTITIILLIKVFHEGINFGGTRNSLFWALVIYKQALDCEFTFIFWGNIHRLFYAINKEILKEYKEMKEIQNQDLSEKILNLKNLSKIHYDLTNLLMKFNSILSFDLIVWMATNFVSSVTQTFFVISSYLKGKLIVVYFAWLLLDLFKTYFIICTCSSISDEANRTVIILHDIWNERIKTRRIRQKMQYLQYISMRFQTTKMKLTAYGFFPLDKTILHSFVAAASTYIIILLQWNGLI